MSYLNAFCKQLENLSEELCELYPTDINLKTANTSIQLLKKTNPRKLLDLFKNYILKYENEILLKDESFFIKKNYKDDVSVDVVYENYTSIIDLLKKYWSSMTSKSKENIWLYLIVLIKLTKKI